MPSDPQTFTDSSRGTPACPGRDVLVAFHLGDLPLDKLQTVADHLDQCPTCAAVVHDLSNEGSKDQVIASLGRLKGAQAVPAATLRVSRQDLALGAESADPPEAGSATRHFGAPLPEQLREYRLLEKIGQGGMATVYRAVHTRLDRTFAVKVLPLSRTDRPEAVARFRREMKAVGRLRHPNIVQATDAGEENGVHFLVMEFVEGSDLSALVGRLGRLAPAVACEVVRQAALGLQHAHDAGLVHRDVKPSNLILTPGGEVKLLDLGLALLGGDKAADGGGTASSLVLGSFDYIAPEQGNDSHTVDGRADLYSLGCTLYHLLTGWPPFPAPHFRTPLQKLQAHTSRAVPPLANVVPEVAPALAAVVERLLAKSPADRFGTAGETATALEPFACGPRAPELLQLAAAGGTPAAPRARTPLPDEQSWTAQTRPPRRRRLPLVIACLAAILLLPLGVMLLRTPDGTLEIDTDDDDVRVVVERGGELVKVQDLKSGKTVELRPGKYRLRTEGREDLVLDSPDVDLERGRRVVARIRRKPSDLLEPVALPPAPTPADLARTPAAADALRPALIPPRLRAMAGGGDPEKAPADLVAVLGVPGLRYPGRIDSIHFSADGKTLAAAGWRHNIMVWDAATGEPGGGGPGPADAWLRSAVYSPARDSLATAAQDGYVRLWNLQGGSLQFEHRVNASALSVAFSPDGTVLAAGTGNSMVHLLDVATGEELNAFKVSEHSWVERLAFSPDGTLLAVGSGATPLRLFDPATGEQVRVMQGHKDAAWAVAFSPDGKTLASGSWDGTVKLWDPNTGRERRTLDGHEGKVWVVEFSPDGRTVASGGSDKVVRLWDVATGKERLTLRVHLDGVRALSFRRDGRVLASADEIGRVALWDTETGDPVGPTRGHFGQVFSLAVSPDGKTVASGGEDTTVRLWDLASGKSLRTLRGHAWLSHQVAFSPDGKTVASASWDGSAMLWDTATGEVRRTIRPPSRGLFGVAFFPTGAALVTCSHDATARVFETATGKELRIFGGHSQGIDGLALSPDGRFLATASYDGTVVVRRLPSGEQLQVLDDHAGRMTRVAFLPDGRRLLSGGVDGVLRLWNVTTGKLVGRVNAHENWIVGLATCRDARRVATSSQDRTVRLWDVSGAEPVASRATPVFVSPERIHTVALTPEGRYLLVGDHNGLIYVLRLSPPPK
jgi:WD40 repeat protein/serine/threonine protein kinase